jgi:hypothetical protein
VIFARTSPGGATFFDTGELDLYGSDQLSDRWSILGEVLLQHSRRSPGADPPPKDFELDAERLYAAYQRSDRLRVEIGQVHTGLIAWNEREHRSRFLQTPIDVPSIARGEEQGGAWPLHFIGVWASGRLPGRAGLTYGAGSGVARGRLRDEISSVIEDIQRPAALLSLRASPDAVSGLEAGAAIYSGDIPARDGRMREVDTTLSTSYVRGGLELRSEWAEMHHRRIADDRRFITRGWYALASARPRGRWKVLRPYLLFDHLEVAPGESYLNELHDQRAWAAGVRWDVERRLAVKTDLRRQRAGERELRIQLAFSF